KKAVLFWSGGKDSAMALHRLKQNPQVEIMGLVTTLNSDFKRISMHGIAEKVLDRQAEQLGFPVIKMWVSNQPDNYSYEASFLKTCTQLVEMDVDTLVFGDIFLEDLRIYREDLTTKAGLKTYFPLWKSSSVELQKELSEGGFEAITCCVQSDKLGKDWIGKQLNPEFFMKLPPGIDPFGENGEFHTFCYNGPVFRNPITYETGEVVFKPLQIKQTDRAGFLYLDII
ncbi:MAG TPA: adenine nucleotide alpha hydrolase, partial [Daejeonella sp.]|nr:adenine nucleotide alpha hydrolase [Daejeonella sp.]